jgi:hypothetical protein
MTPLESGISQPPCAGFTPLLRAWEIGMGGASSCCHHPFFLDLMRFSSRAHDGNSVGVVNCSATPPFLSKIQCSIPSIGFIETLKLERRSIFRCDSVEPHSRSSYGFIFKCGPVPYLKVIGWMGETISVLKLFGKEIVW